MTVKVRNLSAVVVWIAGCMATADLAANDAPLAAPDSSTSPRLAKYEVGIIFMHGRLGVPDYLSPLARALRDEGYLIETPVTSWSKNRSFDSTVDESMAEIDLIADGLRAQGARRLIVGGHSLGGAAALRYGATRANVDGLILIAASWNPASPSWQRIVDESIGRAREAINAGRDRDTATYQYVTNDGKSAPVVAHARGYFDFNRPDSSMALATNARKFGRTVPVIWLSASNDSATARQVASDAFRSLPAHAQSRHETLAASHNGAITAAATTVSAWLDILRQ